MDRLFLDANVLFTAAHNPLGKAAFLIEPPGEAPWRVITSALAVAEALRNIRLKAPQSVVRLQDLARRVALVPQPPPAPVSVALPEKDRPIYAAARAARASHLITGDLRHFGALMNRPAATDGMVVQTVSDYLRGL
ncbi:MAG: hypothetical protein SFV21_09750 [Rhodospirillaceae bacterium]|nr:hypothetical protein [Rhodospirillaceae bacterium]